jgi:predicted enzyme related to lactoylglutathione lyase
MDAVLGEGMRWAQLALPGAHTHLALVAAGDGLPTGVDTGIRLAADDARVAHAAVTAAGLDAGELLDWPGVPLMFSFVDPDGNRFYVSET